MRLKNWGCLVCDVIFIDFLEFVFIFQDQKSESFDQETEKLMKQMHELWNTICEINFDKDAIEIRHKVGIFSGGGRWTLERSVCFSDNRNPIFDLCKFTPFSGYTTVVRTG